MTVFALQVTVFTRDLNSIDCKLVNAMGGAPGGNDLAWDMLMMVLEMMVVGAL